MKTRSIVTFSLLAIIILVGCAPAPAPALVEPQLPPQPAEPVIEEPPAPAPDPAEIEPTVAPTELPPTTEAPAVEPAPEFVSRGPELEATDPATVSLASGNLQLVEFFRYT